jgi:hypothetical protein
MKTEVSVTSQTDGRLPVTTEVTVDDNTSNSKFLAVTCQDMLSKDYKERFRAEYEQLYIRRYLLAAMLDKYEKGELEFDLNTPVDILKIQLNLMNDLFAVLTDRAVVEDIDGGWLTEHIRHFKCEREVQFRYEMTPDVGLTAYVPYLLSH